MVTMSNTLSVMVAGYLECALWSSTEPDSDVGVPLDRTHSVDDFTEAARATAERTCDEFVEANREDVLALLAEGVELAHIGHDLWLTRNHHGAGFWDRGYADSLARRLTESAHALGEATVWPDDGSLHFDI